MKTYKVYLIWSYILKVNAKRKCRIVSVKPEDLTVIEKLTREVYCAKPGTQGLRCKVPTLRTFLTGRGAHPATAGGSWCHAGGMRTRLASAVADPRGPRVSGCEGKK